MSCLLDEIRRCEVCKGDLPLGPRPVLQASATARLRIVGQAPGRRVHETGVPWNDPSGDKLRSWLGLSPATFYDSRTIALVPIGFCYPGRTASGDKPPRPECAPRWHQRLQDLMPRAELTLLVGRYAQAHYLGDRQAASMTETVRILRDYRPAGFLPLPHPSPRNRPWLAANAWFEMLVVPQLQASIRSLGF
jgi:uracil-DNA glycosylase